MSIVSLHGPVFDGRAFAITEVFIKTAERAIAEEGVRMLEARFGKTFKHPTGRYESLVHVRSDPHGHVITDGGCVYGPWLEGVGSRNKTTRFKGYANFRKTTQDLQSKANGISAATLNRYIGKMNA